MKKANTSNKINDVLTLFKEWKSTLTKDDKIILYEYTKYLYEEVNSFLIDEILNDDSFGSSPDDLVIKNAIEKIDEILDRFILKHMILVYRNEHHDIELEDLYEFINGLDKIEYKNFVSTSITEEAFERFFENLKNHYPTEAFLRMKGNLSVGSSCGFIDKEMSAMADQEDEILIARNITFYINSQNIKIDYANKVVCINGEFRKE
ncbi:MAG: ADP-ribosyltransferase [Cetobacterium sp.]